MLRRETIIALRARHTAFRIALDILHPHLQAPPLPEPVVPSPPVDLDVEAGWFEQHQRRQRRHHRIVIAFVAALWAAAIVIGILNWSRPTSVPEPPPFARPISPR